MKDTKFSLADLLTLTAALVYGFVCFLSFNFDSLGDSRQSMLWAGLIALLLGGLALGIKLLKRASTNFKFTIIMEWVLLLPFVLASLIFMPFFAHFFAVSAQKDSIQANINNGLDDAESMYTAYKKYADNRLKVYENQLLSVAAAKEINPSSYSQYGFWGDTHDSIQISTKVDDILEPKLYPSNYEAIKENNLVWLNKAKKSVQEWKPIGVVGVVNELNANINKWKEELISYSSFKAQGEEPEVFDYALTLEEVSDQFVVGAAKVPILAYILSLSLCLLMLFSYIITPRHTRFPGMRIVFGGSRRNKDSSQKADNEW